MGSRGSARRFAPWGRWTDAHPAPPPFRGIRSRSGHVPLGMKRLLLSVPFLLTVLGPLSQAVAIEEPSHEVLAKDGDLEVRAYRGFGVITTPLTREDRNGAFSRLFQYIDGGNREGAKIAMTAPVLIHRETAGNGRMAFVAPATFSGEDLPAPESDRVSTGRMEPMTVAVLRFQAGPREGPPEGAADRLAAWARDRGYTPAGPATAAYYNPPWTPRFLRRSELWLPVTAPKRTTP